MCSNEAQPGTRGRATDDRPGVQPPGPRRRADRRQEPSSSPCPKKRERSSSTSASWTSPTARVPAIEKINLSIRAREITAFIGPSGCGKSTVPALPQPHERPHRRRDASAASSLYHGDRPLRARRSTRSRSGAASAWCSRSRTRSRSRSTTTSRSGRGSTAQRRGLDEIVEEALTKAALWDEVKDKLKKSAFALSGGQQQRLCIARALAVEPDVVLMDEPCSSLDPIATGRIEDLMAELKRDYTIVIVTHNMQQAARVVGPHRVPHRRGRDDGQPHRRAGRVRHDREDLHQPVGSTHRGLHHRSVRLSLRTQAHRRGRRRRADDGSGRSAELRGRARPLRRGARRASPDAVIVVDAEGTSRAPQRGRRALPRRSPQRRPRRGRRSTSCWTGARTGQRDERELQLFGPPREVLLPARAAPGRSTAAILGAVVFIRDVSEARRVESVRRDFVANVSHELKTPIGALALLAETMAAGGDAGGHAPARRPRRPRGRPAGRIIDDLLDLSLIEAQESPSASRCRCRSSSPRRSRACASRPRPRRHPAAGRAERRRHARVACDRRQVLSALTNLLDNAIKYSEPPSPVELAATQLGRRWSTITVTRPRHRDPVARPRADLRALLPRRPGPQPRHRRHRPRPRDRPPRRAGPRRRRHRASPARAKARRSGSASPLAPNGRPTGSTTCSKTDADGRSAARSSSSTTSSRTATR